jgi:hypothetical protein
MSNHQKIKELLTEFLQSDKILFCTQQEVENNFNEFCTKNDVNIPDLKIYVSDKSTIEGKCYSNKHPTIFVEFSLIAHNDGSLSFFVI